MSNGATGFIEHDAAGPRARALWALLAASMLAACSGGGSDEAPPSAAAPNHPPLVDAGEPQSAQGGGLVVLRGAAIDPDGGDMSFLWRQIGGPGVTLRDANSPVATFETPAYIDQATLDFELVVTDSANLPATDNTDVVVVSGFLPCKVTGVPDGLRVDTNFYRKHCDANGQAVLASSPVPDLAVQWVRFQALEMLKRLPMAARSMVRNGSRIAIKDRSQVLTDIPEYSDLYLHYSGQNWNALPGAGAVVGRPVTSTSEENVLCAGDDPYEGFSVFIHEFAHSIHLIGLQFSDPTFDPRLRQTYETAIASGLWANTYSATNEMEYWAEGVGIWFNAHWSTRNSPAVIDTREELAQYDDGLYRLIREYFTEDEIPLCPLPNP